VNIIPKTDNYVLQKYAATVRIVGPTTALRFSHRPTD
jgi:hypothetical protein